ILDDFVLLSGQRGPNLESAVEHFSDFSRFCSTFEAAHLKFEGGGRTFFRPLRATRSDYGQNAVF
ncbi:MAG: hypothetical protein ACIRZ2_09110, partial [Ligilactobacillus ruminis]